LFLCDKFENNHLYRADITLFIFKSRSFVRNFFRSCGTYNTCVASTALILFLMKFLSFLNSNNKLRKILGILLNDYISERDPKKSKIASMLEIE